MGVTGLGQVSTVGTSASGSVMAFGKFVLINRWNLFQLGETLVCLFATRAGKDNLQESSA